MIPPKIKRRFQRRVRRARRRLYRRRRNVLKRAFHPGITRTAIQRGVRPFADSQICNLRYVDSLTIGPGGGAGLSAHHFFRANGVFDPDFTGTGHQPPGS